MITGRVLEQDRRRFVQTAADASFSAGEHDKATFKVC